MHFYQGSASKFCNNIKVHLCMSLDLTHKHQVVCQNMQSTFQFAVCCRLSCGLIELLLLDMDLYFTNNHWQVTVPTAVPEGVVCNSSNIWQTHWPETLAVLPLDSKEYNAHQHQSLKSTAATHL